MFSSFSVSATTFVASYLSLLNWHNLWLIWPGKRYHSSGTWIVRLLLVDSRLAYRKLLSWWSLIQINLWKYGVMHRIMHVVLYWYKKMNLVGDQWNIFLSDWMLRRWITSVTEREFVGVLQALRTWHHYLVGRPVTVRTDHASLRYLLTQPQLSRHLARWLDFLG